MTAGPMIDPACFLDDHKDAPDCDLSQSGASHTYHFTPDQFVGPVVLVSGFKDDPPASAVRHGREVPEASKCHRWSAT